MSTREHLRHVSGWLADLANLTAGTAPLADAKTKIAAVAGMLADEFPWSEAFTKHSLYAMSRLFKYFPSYAEVSGALGPWWNDNRPQVTSDLIGTDDATLDPDDLGWLRNWQRHKDGGFSPMSPAAHLRLCQQQRPRAFAYLLRTDTQAAEVAVLNGWTLPGNRTAPTADEIAHVERVSAEARAAIAATASGLHARAPAHMTEAGARTVEEAVEQVRRDYDKAYPPKVNTPEEIEAMRAANPAVQKARADQAGRTVDAAPPRWDEPTDPPANDRTQAPQRAAAAAMTPPPAVRFPWHDDADAEAVP